MYKLQRSPMTGEVSMVVRLLDSAYIPMSEDNTDYQDYLKWLEEGNTPEPADQQGAE